MAFTNFLVIFDQKYFFTLVQKEIWAKKKKNILAISQKYNFLAKNLTI